MTTPTSAALLLAKLGHVTAARFRDVLAPIGLEPRQYHVLRALAANEGQSQQAVCAAVQVPPSRMVALVDDLETRGLVERRPNAVDRRARAVHLTDSGRELLARACALAREHERWVCEPLDAAEHAQLIATLGRLLERHGVLCEGSFDAAGESAPASEQEAPATA